MLKSPYPYFGGKSKIAVEVWKRFGKVSNYVEPFFGSGAVLLARPHGESGYGVETVNDLDGFIVNFWRAVRHDFEKVLQWLDYPISEKDLEARHGWLVNRKERLIWSLEDPDFYDVKIAGWWVWGLSQWLGSGFCLGRGAVFSNGAHLFREAGPLGASIRLGIPLLSNEGNGIHRKTLRGGQREYLADLSERLRYVRIICGDWTRVVKPSVTTKHGLTAVFLDPPYDMGVGRGEVYNYETAVSSAVRIWAIENGENSLFRIALCGYEGEHEMPSNWECVAWRASGGYGNHRKDKSNVNRYRERVWFSPGCGRAG